MPGVFAQRDLSPNDTKCFVMMPFADAFSAIYRLIQRCCKEQGLICERADEDVRPGKITSKIYDSVCGAGIIIADMTGRNPNVFYELGLAHAICDNVILLTQSADDVPFDLKDFIHIQYNNTFDGAEKLANDLSKVLTTILRSAAPPRRQLSEQNETDVHDDDFGDESLDLGLFHLRAEMARNVGDLATSREWLRKAMDLASRGEDNAAEIGNCAIEAERCRFYDFAEALYELALARDPMHVNNRQCYASFILDHRSTNGEKMQVAGKLLDELESAPERQERTRALRAQFLTITQAQSGTPIDYDSIIATVLGDGEFVSIQQAAPALLLLQRAHRYPEMRNVINSLKERLGEDAHSQLDRILADALASSNERKDEDEAVNIYEVLLSSGADDSADLKHNLATLIYSHDSVDAEGRAGKLWRDAYSQKPSDTSIRKAFARYLIRHKRAEQATKVLEGKPLSD